MADKIELSVECVRALLKLCDGWALQGTKSKEPVDEARAALAKHERLKNPLGLPWTVSHGHGCYAVHDASGNQIAGTGSEKKANLIAAAPDLAECLAALTKGDCDCGCTCFDDEVQLANQALDKAGWGGVGE